MSQAIRSHEMLSEKFEKFYYDEIQCLDQSDVFQFTQKNPLPRKGNWSHLGENYPTSSFMIHFLRIVLKFCDILGHNT